MVDFSKFRMPSESTYVTYRCERCNEEDEYILELPDHMKTHNPDRAMRNCGGRLVEVSRRVVPRKTHS